MAPWLQCGCQCQECCPTWAVASEAKDRKIPDTTKIIQMYETSTLTTYAITKDALGTMFELAGDGSIKLTSQMPIFYVSGPGNSTSFVSAAVNGTALAQAGATFSLCLSLESGDCSSDFGLTCRKKNENKCGIQYSSPVQATWCPIQYPSSWPAIMQVRIVASLAVHVAPWHVHEDNDLHKAPCVSLDNYHPDCWVCRLLSILWQLHSKHYASCILGEFGQLSSQQSALLTPGLLNAFVLYGIIVWWG